MVFTEGNKVSRTIWLQSKKTAFGWQKDASQFKGIFVDSGVTFFFSEFSFNCTSGQYNGLWRYGDKRSGPETEPTCIEFQAQVIFRFIFILHTQTKSLDQWLNVLNAS